MRYSRLLREKNAASELKALKTYPPSPNSPRPRLMQEEGGRGSRVIYSALNRCRVKFFLEPLNKALRP